MKLLDEHWTLPEMGAITDSAFPVSNELFKKIITPLKEGDLQILIQRVQAASIILSNTITSV